MIAVEIKNLTKKFDQLVAIDNISLEVEKGKIVGIIGPDGAGKTTFLRLCAGLGYMPQHFSLYGDLTVAENLKFFADLFGVPKKKFQKRKDELLHFSGLTPFEERQGWNLSGGMQKKLALASNLFHTPEILLLDEPTTGVDPVSRRELWNLLFQLNKQGTTLFITTPYMDEAQKCHDVGFLYQGRLLSFKPPQSLIQEMKDEVVELATEQKQARELLRNIPGLKNIYPYGEALHLIFEPGEKAEERAKEFLEKHGIRVLSLKKIAPSFEDAFLTLVMEQEAKRVAKPGSENIPVEQT